MSLRTPLLAAAAAVVLAGCGSIGGPKVAIKVYSPPTQVLADPAWPQVDWTLAVGASAAIEALDSPRIAVRPTPNELQTYKGAAWADTAPEMLRGAIVEGFEESGRVGSVVRIGGGSGSERADIGLYLDVRAFEGDYASGAPEAVVEVQARLAVRGASPAVPSMVDAFGTAMSALATEVVGWTLVEGERLREGSRGAGD